MLVEVVRKSSSLTKHCASSSHRGTEDWETAAVMSCGKGDMSRRLHALLRFPAFLSSLFSGRTTKRPAEATQLTFPLTNLSFLSAPTDGSMDSRRHRRARLTRYLRAAERTYVQLSLPNKRLIYLSAQSLAPFMAAGEWPAN